MCKIPQSHLLALIVSELKLLILQRISFLVSLSLEEILRHGVATVWLVLQLRDELVVRVVY